VLPGWDTFRAQIIHERFWLGPAPSVSRGRQIFIEEIPFLFKAIEAAGSFPGWLFQSEKVFVGEFRGDIKFLYCFGILICLLLSQ